MMDPEANVDMSELARKMLRWEEAQLFADDLRAEIKSAVMRIGRTQTVGNVRASYSGGRKSYDYHAGAASVSAPIINRGIIERFTIVPPPRVDWRKICEHVGVNKADIPFTQGDPSVAVKLLPE